MDEKTIEVECLVEDVVYQNEDSGFAVLQVTSDGVSFVAVGELFGVEEGENLMARGFYVDHSIYVFWRKDPGDHPARSGFAFPS